MSMQSKMNHCGYYTNTPQCHMMNRTGCPWRRSLHLAKLANCDFVVKSVQIECAGLAKSIQIEHTVISPTRRCAVNNSRIKLPSWRVWAIFIHYAGLVTYTTRAFKRSVSMIFNVGLRLRAYTRIAGLIYEWGLQPHESQQHNTHR